MSRLLQLSASLALASAALLLHGAGQLLLIFHQQDAAGPERP